MGEIFGKTIKNYSMKMAFVAVLAVVMAFGAIGSAEATVTLLDGATWSAGTLAVPAPTAYTYSAPAGNDRAVVVHISGEGTGALSSVTIGGSPATIIAEFQGGNAYAAAAYALIGSSGTATSANIAVTWTTQPATGGAITAATYGGVLQTGGTGAGTAVNTFGANGANATGAVDVTGITVLQTGSDIGLVIYQLAENTGVVGAISTTGPWTFTQRYSAVPTSYGSSGGDSNNAAGTGTVTSTTTQNRQAFVVFSLAPAVSCSDPDAATLTTTNPTTSSTVNGFVTVQAQVGVETTPSGMTGMVVNIAGAGACNVTNGVMSWNGSSSRWEYTWNTSACGTGTPVTGVTVDVSGADPDCGTTVNATQITNVTIDNTCTDPNLATLTITAPVDGGTARGTRTVSVSVGGGQTASAMTTMQVMINGSWRGMSWGGTTWDYTWNTLADYPASATTPVLGVTIDAHGTDPTCSTVVDAPQISVKVDNTDPSKMASCADCHGYDGVFGDGTVRNNPVGQFPGSHNTHVVEYSKACSTCHVAPATTTSADYKHRDGIVNMAAALGRPGGGTAGTYARGSFTQVNNSTGLTTCSNTYCHSNGTSATTPAGSIPNNTSATWGGSTTCSSCHGTGADGRPNYADGTPKANKHQAATHAAQTCDVCHSSVTWDGSTYTPDPSLHNNAVYNLQPSMGYTPGTAAAGGTCTTPGCHNSVTWGGSLACTDCHNAVVAAPVASSVSAGTVTTRPDIVSSFSLASNHIRSDAGSVNSSDCAVCHMEGNAADGSVNGTYHKNGYIELRDPDLGTTIKGVTHSGTTSAPGVWSSTGTDARPVRFSRDLASATIEGDTAAIMVNHCLKCHDTNGANSTLARVPGGTAGQPFGNAIAANPGSNVLDVAGQFASTNRAFHPVMVRQNNGYTNTGGTRMVAPWNGVTKTGTTTVYGPLITCWDCHAPNGASGTMTTSGVHGGAPGNNNVPLRGDIWNTTTAAQTATQNLCVNCHVVSGGTQNHGTGSAITSNTNNGMTYFNNRCQFCHMSYATKPARPNPAADVHGYDTRSAAAGGGAFPNARAGYAFIRNEGWYSNATTHLVRQVGATTGTSNCGGVTNTGGTGGCSRGSMGNYTPGGVF